MKVLYIQWSGNLHEAYNTLYVENKGENYYGQKYSVEAVVNIARSGTDVLVITLQSDGYDEKLEDNLRNIGLKQGKIDYLRLESEIKAFAPDRVILRVPDPKILKFLRKSSIHTFPVLADSFKVPKKIKALINKYLLSKELQHECIQWIANHQINAAISIQSLGVNPSKILAYDWEHLDTPENWTKTIPSDITSKDIEVFFAGGIFKTKGTFDLIKSAKYIKQQGRKIKIKIAGRGYDAETEAFVKAHNVADSIEFLGLIDHEAVLANMNKSDAVIVPSHHSYPEGLPMTIMESLMTHTPVIASDHPMFVGRVGLRGAVQFFKAEHPEDLARTILATCGSQDGYEEMSRNAPIEWNELTLNLKWAEMIERWIESPESCNFSGETLKDILSTKKINN